MFGLIDDLVTWEMLMKFWFLSEKNKVSILLGKFKKKILQKTL